MNPQKTEKNPKNLLYSRWGIVAAAAVMNGLAMGITCNCIAIYAIPVSEGLGISRAMYFTTQSLYFGAVMLTSIIAGRVTEAVGTVRILKVMSLLLSAFYFANSLVGSYGQFAVLSVLLGISETFLTTVPLSLLVRKWFPRNFGFPLGFVLMGSGLGGLLGSQASNALIESVGWRMSYRVMSVFILVVSELICFLVIREPSGDEFRYLCGADSETTSKVSPVARQALSNRPFAEDVRSFRFWAVMVFACFLGIESYTSLCLLSVFLQDVGYSASYAAMIYGLGMGSLAVGKVVIGRIYDRFGNVIFTVTGLVTLAAGLSGYCLLGMAGGASAAAGMNVLSMALIFLGTFLGNPMGSVACACEVRFFLGDRDYASKLGIYVAFGSLGGAVAPTISGMICEAAGSYIPYFGIMLAAVPVGLFLFLLEVYRKWKNMITLSEQ